MRATRADSHPLKVVLFAGCGGACQGIEGATGEAPDVAINHDEIALAVHKANHPHTEHRREDVWKAPPLVVTKGQPVGLLWASPDCFPAGTLVLTRDGYRAIECVQVGDAVLTHTGRWRKVTATMSAMKPLVRLRGHGHPGLVASTEHPFYVRQRKNGWVGKQRVKSFSARAWVPADKLDKGMYWASPVEFPDANPPPVPVYNERTMTITPELLWLAGLYVADGWTRLTETRAELTITCGLHEVQSLRERLAYWNRAGARAGADEFSWQERGTSTAYQFTTSHRGFVEWLRKHFGHRAENKRIPGWVLGMHADLRKAFLNGYLLGDGWCADAGAVVEASTVSKSLAFGIKALAGSLGKTVAAYVQQNSGVIQGRAVNSRPLWKLRWRDEVAASRRQTHRFKEDAHLEWAPIREREDLDEVARVFNISVEEDESYVVEGVVVHNCTHFSAAKGDKPREKGIRSLAWVVRDWARDVRPRIIFLENVWEFLGWGPLFEVGAVVCQEVILGSSARRRVFPAGTVVTEGHPLEGRPVPWRKGETFRQFVGSLELLGYTVEWKVLDASAYGAPTKRRRLFLVARCDGESIRWPEATHGPGRLPYHTAAECIDWSLPCPSIFGRERPLAEKTLKRIADGVRRYVLESPRPFVVGCGGRAGQTPPTPVDAPLGTITAKNDRALVVPSLVQTGYGERQGQRPRSLNLHEPLGTIMATGQKHALVAAFLAKHFGGVVGQPVNEPTSTITATDHHGLVTATLDVEALERTNARKVAAFLTTYYGSGGGQALDKPMRTITATDRLGLVTVQLDGVPHVVTDIGMRMLQPHELLKAQFGRYAEGFDLSAAPTKRDQVRLIGNSVCPEVAEALVRANLPEEAGLEVAA